MNDYLHVHWSDTALVHHQTDILIDIHMISS